MDSQENRQKRNRKIPPPHGTVFAIPNPLPVPKPSPDQLPTISSQPTYYCIQAVKSLRNQRYCISRADFFVQWRAMSLGFHRVRATDDVGVTQSRRLIWQYLLLPAPRCKGTWPN